VNAKKDYLDIAEYAVGRAKAAGTAAAEACVTDTESTQVTVSGREVEQMNAVKEAGIGVRVMRDGKMAFGSTNDLSRGAVRELVEGLAAKAVYHTADEFNVIPGPEDGTAAGGWPTGADAELGVYDPMVAETPVQDKIRTALRMEAAGLDADPKIAGSMIAFYQDGTTYTYLANSNGVRGWFRQSGCGGGLELSAADADERESGSFTKVVGRFAEFDPEEVGRKAAANAVAMLGARPIASCEVPLVVSPEIGTQILSFVAGMLSADAVQKGRSLFAGKVGTEVGAKGFTLVDDGRLEGGLDTAPVDGEGIPRQTTVLIEKGVLKTFLYDCYCARKGKARSTGNRSRSGYGSMGAVGTTNLYIKPGTASEEEVLAGIDRGFYLTVVLGLFAAIDSASGDFSIPSAGFLIEKGQKTIPVRGVSIGGNLFQLLKDVDTVGGNLTWFQSVASPTFRVRSVAIAGK